MPKLTLYVAPGSCARVPTIALEEIGVPFATELVRFKAQQHKSEAYRALNPKGKVPVLVVDSTPLTENVAILSWLNSRFPDAALLPPVETPFAQAQQLSDLAFVSSTLHPIVTRIRVPYLFGSTPEIQADVREKGMTAMQPFAQLLEERFDKGRWWYGESWSIVDAYLYWVWWRIVGAGFPVECFPRLQDFAQRIERRPSVMRALAREADQEQMLNDEGLSLNLT
ncbi:glutathione S-transferase family protein [Pararhodobacter oceanensis]|uniref:Glutathione S-transferase family protein n=1 Tax=Pararhodobacter oceanensis TaxID=2172121 RepID=A0A2T8HTG7_9RHOB|nr:glutathione S-transferase family protein [Pararhodobacter oceanensis]PVH28696.1 glutathione S-transferase family protein [Pararhodobacter oceanensis]